MLISIEQDVGRFQVAVQKAALVRVMHCSRHIHDQPGGGLLIFLEATQMLVQAPALDQLHAQKGTALVLGYVENSHDVGMLQLRHALGFGPETAHFLSRDQMARQGHL